MFYSNSNFYPPSPLLYRKWNFVFRCAPRAYSDLNIEFISNLYIDHSLLTNTSHSYHNDRFLHPIWDFYCNCTEKSIFRHFLLYVWCKKWSKIFLKQNNKNRLDNFFHYIFLKVFSSILWHAIQYPTMRKPLQLESSKKGTFILCTFSHIC